MIIFINIIVRDKTTAWLELIYDEAFIHQIATVFNGIVCRLSICINESDKFYTLSFDKVDAKIKPFSVECLATLDSQLNCKLNLN